MPRLFTGIALPEDVADDLFDLSMPLPGVRWIDAEDMHVTLRFLGDIDNRTANEVVLGLAGIDSSAFSMRLTGLGTFGGKEPRTLWAGVEAGPELERLARANERAARNAGLAPETRKFQPHVTIARLSSPRIDALARFMQRHGGFRTEPFLVTHFSLFSSKPQTGGGPYVEEETFALQGGSYAAGGDEWRE